MTGSFGLAYHPHLLWPLQKDSASCNPGSTRRTAREPESELIRSLASREIWHFMKALRGPEAASRPRSLVGRIIFVQLSSEAGAESAGASLARSRRARLNRVFANKFARKLGHSGDRLNATSGTAATAANVLPVLAANVADFKLRKKRLLRHLDRLSCVRGALSAKPAHWLWSHSGKSFSQGQPITGPSWS